MERDFATNTGIAVDINFNSHAHVERDQQGSCNHRLFVQISTHTLTWSVTSVEHGIYKGSCISTHTLTWSVTSVEHGIYKGSCISTHTLTWSVTASILSLNSSQTISTHTLTWSVTLDVVYIWCLLNVMRTYFFI